MLKRIEHIGIVVEDLEKSLRSYRDLLGLPLDGIEEVDFEDSLVRVAFLPLGETEVELVHTTAKSGLAAEFFQKHGEGVHHIAFEVDDIDVYYETMLAKGVKFLFGGIVPGSRNTRTLFFAPEEFNGVCIEVIQKP